MTDKTTTNIISRVGYDGASYTHQGWVTDKAWQTTLVLVRRPASNAPAYSFEITLINYNYGLWSIKLTFTRMTSTTSTTPLELVLTVSPCPTSGTSPASRRRSFPGTSRTSTPSASTTTSSCQYHPVLITVCNSLTPTRIDGVAYQSNYGAGLHVLDVSSLETDKTGAGVTELGYFDIYPENDALPGGGSIEFVGTWGHYPYFPSGFIVVNTIERGAFVVKRTNA